VDESTILEDHPNNSEMEQVESNIERDIAASLEGRESRTDSTLNPNRFDFKTIYFIRHEESISNVKSRQCKSCFTGGDDKDPKLSDYGNKKVDDLKSRLIEEKIMDEIQLVITSPLTRSLQTSRAFEDTPLPIIVTNLHTEIVDSISDVGRSPEELQNEFPMLKFNHLDPVWWYSNGKNKITKEPKDHLDKRVSDFRGYLMDLNESKVVVIGHNRFFAKLAGIQLTPGQVLKVGMDEKGRFDTPPKSWTASCFAPRQAKQAQA